VIAIRRKYPFLNFYDRILDIFKDQSFIMQARQEMFNLACQKVSRRLDQGSDRPDFFTHILKNQESGKNALTRDEMDSNALLLLNAGSETTATTLSGTTWLLLKDPARLAKAVAEVRSTYNSQDEITMESVARLSYVIACLQEGLRYYPPVPTGFPRVVPPGGDTISGYYIPAGVSFPIRNFA
jgi:cytochrome P450